MPTRNVVLSDHHAEFIQQLVKSGRYQNASEVLREGLRLIEQKEMREAAKLKFLQEAANTGFTDLDEGRFIDIEDNELADHIRHLGHQAQQRVKKANA